MIDIAYAMGGGGAEGAAGFSGFIPIILMFVIFYFLLIRPQQKRQKEHRSMISSLKKGDRIITSGGLHGRITGIDDTTLTLEIADDCRLGEHFFRLRTHENLSEMLSFWVSPFP